MTGAYTYFTELAKQIEIPANGILSRTLHQDENLKAVLFGFDAGQELSEHTSSKPAILQIIQGEAKLTLANDTVEANPGAWIYMPANLKHGVYAQTPVIMLLLLIKS
ncbi:MAG: cupin domain-containing protein [candidate division KSB1 bacterium]|nr:cupin domain-containing protein [candidate division KSB1 bacterium]MDZ7368323.1 cupin domain-containing protein [candidate division KSB1 bacterium]MDZ7403043.1 cupin domain-containing protein [candidate division KSB1 bacterium]